MALRPIQDAIAEYQSKTPYSRQAFEGLFPYLTGLGYKVARTTHANNTLASNDALTTDTGEVYDLVFDSDAASGPSRWLNARNGSYDPSRKVVGPTGSFIGFNDWVGTAGTSGTQPGTLLGGTPAPTKVTGGAGYTAGMKARAKAGTGTGAAPTPTGLQLPSPNPFGDAMHAATRQRGKSNKGGRTSTILGGFGGGRPSTRLATLLGGGY